MTKTADKHIGYFQLLDALKDGKSCAFCQIELHGINRYFAWLMYERVNDPGVRAKLRQSRGYCGRHSQFLLAAHEGFGTSILYRDLLSLAVNELRTLEARKRTRKRLFDARGGQQAAKCPACQMQDAVRESSLSVFSRSISDPQLRLALGKTPLICIPHVKLALAMMENDADRRYLVGCVLETCNSVLHQLDEFIRKQDYRFMAEGLGVEADVWQRVVRLMAGESGVFS